LGLDLVVLGVSKKMYPFAQRREYI